MVVIPRSSSRRCEDKNTTVNFKERKNVSISAGKIKKQITDQQWQQKVFQWFKINLFSNLKIQINQRLNRPDQIHLSTQHKHSSALCDRARSFTKSQKVYCRFVLIWIILHMCCFYYIHPMKIVRPDDADSIQLNKIRSLLTVTCTVSVPVEQSQRP